MEEYAHVRDRLRGREIKMRATLSLAMVLVWTACGESKTNSDQKPEEKPEKKAPPVPTVGLAQLAAFVPGTPASSIKSSLDAVGSGATYRANFQDVAAVVAHPWFGSASCETKGYEQVQSCSFRTRPGVLTTENLEAFLAVVDSLEPTLTAVRRKKIWDKVLGTYTFEWGASEFSPDVSLYLEWDGQGKTIQFGNLTICSTPSSQRFPACASAMKALLAAALPPIAGH